MASAVVPRLLARLQRFHLLRRDEGVEFLLGLLMNLTDLLLTLLLAQGRVGADCLYFGPRPLLNGLTLLHRWLGNTRDLPPVLEYEPEETALVRTG